MNQEMKEQAAIRRMLPPVFLAILIFLSMTEASRADMRTTGDTICITGPTAPWEACFPAHGWKLMQRKEHPGRLYYTFRNDNRLYVSFLIEPASQCSTSDSCRVFNWASIKPTMKQAREERVFELNGFSVVSFTVPIIPDDLVFQYSYSAHMVRERTWLDMHVTKFPGTKRNDSQFAAFVNSVVIRPKPSI